MPGAVTMGFIGGEHELEREIPKPPGNPDRHVRRDSRIGGSCVWWRSCTSSTGTKGRTDQGPGSSRADRGPGGSRANGCADGSRPVRWREDPSGGVDFLGDVPGR